MCPACGECVSSNWHSYHMVGHWLALVGWQHATVIYLIALGPVPTSEIQGVTRLFGPSGTSFNCCLPTATAVAGEQWEALGVRPVVGR